MADATTYLKNALYNEVFRAVDYTPPATVYLALFTTATTDAGGGTEVTGGSYARQAVTFGAPTDGAGANTAAVTFSNMPAATVTHFAYYDASTGGNMLTHAALSSSVIFSGGENPSWAIGDLDASVA